MNLHLCLDQKVITRTIKYFEEALPGQNKFIVVLSKSEKDCTYVKEEKPYVYYERYNSKGFWKTVGDIKQYNHIIYHYLHDYFCRFSLAIPKGSPITWIVWGGDLYDHFLVRKGYNLYAEPLKCSKIPAEFQNANFSHLFLYYVKEMIKYSFRKKALKRIESVCACDGDLALLNKYYPDLQQYQRKRFFYYPIDDIISDELKNILCTGNNIIVGNSASLTNNHKYVFEKLKKINLGTRKVIVPLSYGCGKDNALEAGKILGDNFEPLVNFLPLAQYNKILSSASTAIYGNFRQEAIGNILTSIYLGASVFLDEKNPYITDLRNKDYIVFSLDQLPDKINYKLTEEERRHNRELVLRHNNRNLMLSYIKESFGN